MRQAIFCFVISLACGACIDPFSPKVPNGQESIVVDGTITDQPGPYTVKIFKAHELNNQFDKTVWVRGASVRIEDDLGASETLTESSPGNYVSGPGLTGLVGRSYQLKIVSKEGISYESSVEKMLPVGDFTNLRYQFVNDIDPTVEGYDNPSNGFKVFLDADILPEQEGLVRWRWAGTFEVRTNPELRTRILPGPVIREVPDPYPCSGAIPPNYNCTCCYCWATQYNEVPLVSDLHLANNNKISQYQITFIPAIRKYFFSKYYLDVEQMSTSRTVYDFWKNVAAQDRQGTDLFQTPPASTGGNIKRRSESGPPVIGVFAAAAVKKHSFIIYSSEIPYQLPGPDQNPISCLELYTNSTNSQPTFW